MKKLKKERLMYKLVAIDLDGTMLNSYGIVTQNTKNIIKENIKKACFFIINVIECKYKKVIKFKK